MNNIRYISMRPFNGIRKIFTCNEDLFLNGKSSVFRQTTIVAHNISPFRYLSHSASLCREKVDVFTQAKRNDVFQKDFSNVFRESPIDTEYDEMPRSKTNSLSDKTSDEVKGDFSKYPISDGTIQNLKNKGITHLFPVQSATYLDIYDGKDIIVQARTGTGKTLSFAIPIIESMCRKLDKSVGRLPRAIILVPTRELAAQVSSVFTMLTNKLRVSSFYGGTGYGDQSKAIEDGIDVVVGTPGRILDFVQQGMLDFSALEHVVLDEVDRMLDMGFAPQVDDILKAAYVKGTQKPQTCLWSATVPSWVKSTAKKYMDENTRFVDLVGSDMVKTSTTVRHVSLPCNYQERAGLIGDLLKVHTGSHGRAMVFCQTKREADEIAVSPLINVETHVLHGDIPQEKREMVLKGFRDGRYKCLVTTDVAARGLDVPEVDLIIQCCPPLDMDSYIHRSGRTGRAGRQGVSICLFQPAEKIKLREVERYAGISFKLSSPPTPTEVIMASANDVLKSLSDIKPEVLDQFNAIALKASEALGYERALSAAFAVISGTMNVHSRSLLTSARGYKTFMFSTTNVINYHAYVWKTLKRNVSPEVMDNVKYVRISADKHSAYFDVPENLASAIEDQWTDSRFDTLCEAETIPELMEQNTNTRNSYSDQRIGYSDQRNNYSDQRNSYSDQKSFISSSKRNSNVYNKRDNFQRKDQRYNRRNSYNSLRDDSFDYD